MAQSPVASADTSTDWMSSIDSLLTGGTMPALASSALDYQISFDGYDLFPTTGNLATATTTTGEYGLAIAYGAGAIATATDGTGNDGDTAIALGANDTAATGDGNGNFAEVMGPAGSSADAADGNHDIAYLRAPFGSTAGSAFSRDGNYDLSAVVLTDGSATASGSDYLYDIISALGHETAALPTSLATLLTDLSALF